MKGKRSYAAVDVEHFERVVIRRAFGLPRHVRECAAETGVPAE